MDFGTEKDRPKRQWSEYLSELIRVLAEAQKAF
jgi:hypothetical protein